MPKKECPAVIGDYGSCPEYMSDVKGDITCLALWFIKFFGPLHEAGVMGPEDGLLDAKITRKALSPEGHFLLGKWNCAQPEEALAELDRQEELIRSHQNSISQKPNTLPRP